MEITSGSVSGPRLAEPLWKLDNNVDGQVRGSRDPADIAQLLARAGWRVRRSSWTDYEVEHTWAQIRFFRASDGTTSFAGVVDPGQPALLSTTFAGLGLDCVVELAT